MNNRIIPFLVTLLTTAVFALSLSAQTAKSVLDKTAALYSKGAVQVAFTAKAAQGTSSGTLVAQGNKFTLKSNTATIWFDGKTQWSLYTNSDEVDLTEPTAKEIASINPMNFVNTYKSGYKSTLKTVGSTYEVHLTATSSSKSMKEIYVVVDKATSKPKSIKFRTKANDWTTITVSSFQSIAKKGDAYFRYSAKDHPGLQVVDLR